MSYHTANYLTQREYPVLFNHWIGNAYPDIEDDFFDGIAAHSGRAYALTNQRDTIMLPPSLKADFPYIRQHYRRIGLYTTDNIIWSYDHNHQAARELRLSHSYDTFLYNKAAHAVVKNGPLLEAVSLFDDKNRFMNWCTAHDFPTPRTDTYQPGQRPIRTSDSEGPWYVKEAISTNGMGVSRADTWKDVMEVSDPMLVNYQVQEAIDADIFLNVQYFGNITGVATHIATTEQVLNGMKHIGNRYPASFDPRLVTNDVAQEAVHFNLRGVFAFDVAITPQGKVYIIECNPRPNGATYPTGVTQRLSTQCGWTSIKLTGLNGLSLKRFDLKRFEFNPKTKTGLVVTLWGSPDVIGVVAIGTKTQQDVLLDGFERAIRETF